MVAGLSQPTTGTLAGDPWPCTTRRYRATKPKSEGSSGDWPVARARRAGHAVAAPTSAKNSRRFIRCLACRLAGWRERADEFKPGSAPRTPPVSLPNCAKPLACRDTVPLSSSRRSLTCFEFPMPPRKGTLSRPSMSALGHLADIPACRIGHVCFTPESGHETVRARQMSAKRQ